MTLTIYMCLGNKEEDLPAFKIALLHRYNDPKTTSKNADEDWLQRVESIQITQATEQK